MENEYQDKTITCKDCDKEFVWTVGEQQYFAKKGLRNKPTRCKECRQINRKKLEAEYYRVECSNCHLAGEVMFEPKNKDAKVLCKNCFDELYA